MRGDHSPNAKVGYLFETRQAIVDPPKGMEEKIIRLEKGVLDLQECLAGNSKSERWQKIKIELTNLEGTLLITKRRAAGRTPQMESWADPLPG